MSPSPITVTGYAKIIITILNKGLPDDRLSIVPDSESDGYYVKFDQKTIGNKVNCYVSNNRLSHFLDLFFESIRSDLEQPNMIQIDCPMFPTVLLTGERQYSCIPLLNEQIDFLQEDWPFETTQLADE
jgi:hypothetical protein